MKNKSRLFHAFFVSLICMDVFLPILSWLLYTLNLDVNNMLSDRGWRWLFLYGHESAHTYMVCLSVYAVTAYGCYKKSEIQYAHLHSSALWISVGVFTSVLAVLIYFAYTSDSPLLNLSGGLMPSPWSYGMPYAFSLALILMCVLYALFSHRLQNMKSFGQMIGYGISNYGYLILVVMLFIFLLDCIGYMI